MSWRRSMKELATVLASGVVLHLLGWAPKKEARPQLEMLSDAAENQVQLHEC